MTDLTKVFTISSANIAKVYTVPVANIAKVFLTDWPTVSEENTLWAWGSNAQGQLGLEDVAKRSSPVQVGALTTWDEITTGGYSSAAVKIDGTLWTWGSDSYGRLGFETRDVHLSSPVQVGALTTWSKASCGYAFILTIKTDGTLWSWGYNNVGQLGLGDVVMRSSPVQVGALTTWNKIDTGYEQVLAIKTDGTLWAWGYNDYGKLGLGDIAHRSSPVQVGALTTWSKIACYSDYHSLAVKADGTLWAWGQNTFGQLGLGDIAHRSSPVQVGALTTWDEIATGGYFSAAIKTDGTIWAWGRNDTGSLGLEDIAHRSSPVQVGALTTWDKASCGDDYTLAIKTE